MSKILNQDSIRIIGISNEGAHMTISRKFTYLYEEDNVTKRGRGSIQVTQGDSLETCKIKAIAQANTDLGL